MCLSCLPHQVALTSQPGSVCRHRRGHIPRVLKLRDPCVQASSGLTPNAELALASIGVQVNMGIEGEFVASLQDLHSVTSAVSTARLIHLNLYPVTSSSGIEFLNGKQAYLTGFNDLSNSSTDPIAEYGNTTVDVTGTITHYESHPEAIVSEPAGSTGGACLRRVLLGVPQTFALPYWSGDRGWAKVRRFQVFRWFASCYFTSGSASIAARG